MIMSIHRPKLLTLCILCWCGPLFASAQESPPSDAAEARLRRLQAQFEASSRRLDELQKRAQLVSADGVKPDRTEAIKQQIREVLSEREFRESLMPAVTTAGYKDGFYIHSSDDLFSMKIN